MLFKTLTCILALVVVAEGGYIFLHRRPINRFKPVDDDGYAAFDTATGQLCRAFRARPSPKGIQYSRRQRKAKTICTRRAIRDPESNWPDCPKDALARIFNGLFLL